MPKFRSKPKIIEAVRVTAADFNGKTWDGSPFSEMPPWLETAINAETITLAPADTDYAQWNIKTLEGVMRATADDWIIQGIKGEIYPVKDEIFRLTYEPVPDDGVGIYRHKWLR